MVIPEASEPHVHVRCRIMSELSNIPHQLEKVIKPVRRSPWTERIARVGFGAKGTVYMMVGAIALVSSWNGGGETADSRRAIVRLGEQPFGFALLGVLGVGLLGYAVWRFLQAIADPDRRGKGTRAIVERGGSFISGVIHAGLGVFALEAFFSGAAPVGEGGGDERYWTARVLAQPFGEWLIGLIGLIMIGMAVAQFVSARSHNFLNELRTHHMTDVERQWAKRAGEWGFSARGVVFGIIGSFLIAAAVKHDPGEARGVDEALYAILMQPYGPVLLGAVGLGLICFGAFMMVEARYRTVNT